MEGRKTCSPLMDTVRKPQHSVEVVACMSACSIAAVVNAGLRARVLGLLLFWDPCLELLYRVVSVTGTDQHDENTQLLSCKASAVSRTFGVFFSTPHRGAGR